MSDCRCSRCNTPIDRSIKLTAQFENPVSLETYRYILCADCYRQIKTMLNKLYYRNGFEEE